MPTTTTDNSAAVRVDKWLWAARFFKTRSVARQAIEAGHVRINEQRCKPSRELVPGDHVTVTREQEQFDIVVRSVSNIRGPAPRARTLYDETPASVAKRTRDASERVANRTGPVQTGPRPTKRDRRNLERWRADE